MYRSLLTFTVLVFCLISGTAVANAQAVVGQSPGYALIGPSSASPSGQGCETWHIMPSPNPEVISFLNGVTALSAQDIWSVGGHNDFLNTHHLTLTEQWNGKHWRVIPSANKSVNELLATSAVSANDIWTVGEYQKGSNPIKSLIEHWDGTSWQIISSPNVAGKDTILNAVSADSPQDVWATGYSELNLGDYQTLTEHWNGSKWSIVASPNVGSVGDILSGVVAVTPGDAWVVGDATVNFSSSQTLIEHWDGTQWSVVSSPSIDSLENQLSSVAAISAQDIWAVGSATDNGTGAVQTVIEHWDGTQWNLVTSPNPPGGQVAINGLNSVAVVSAQDVWAVGYHEDSSGNLQTLSVHWNGTKWKAVSSPDRGTGENMLKGVAHVPGTNEVVAVGLSDAADFSHTHTLVLATC